jgi:hypothetical protein
VALATFHLDFWPGPRCRILYFATDRQAPEMSASSAPGRRLVQVPLADTFDRLPRPSPEGQCRDYFARIRTNVRFREMMDRVVGSPIADWHLRWLLWVIRTTFTSDTAGKSKPPAQVRESRELVPGSWFSRPVGFRSLASVTGGDVGPANDSSAVMQRP